VWGLLKDKTSTCPLKSEVEEGPLLRKLRVAGSILVTLSQGNGETVKWGCFIGPVNFQLVERNESET
jgi:hypothetical protein